MKSVYSIFIYSLLLLSFNTSAQIQAWGHYTAGCIPNAPKLAQDGTGYHLIRLHRQRYYGHPNLIKTLKALAIDMQPWGKQILIADMSQKNGGKMPSGHRSHQMGLDADILLQAWDNQTLTPKQREALAPVSVLNPDKKSLNTQRFGTWQQHLLQQAAQRPEVARIFINPLIKQALCQQNPKATWLRKLRPWWGHDGHLHIRINCPKDSPNCHNQAPPAMGTGCDASLSAWVTKITKPQKTKPTTVKKPRKPLSLPVICRTK